MLTHLDERAACFFALGLAKASRRPVAVLGTSGTAVANFLPAIVEAHHGRVPLVVLTADRPPELRDRGAAQTIDQAHLYGRFAKWYAELPVPEPGPLAEALVRDVVSRAVATAAEAPAGPVHLNLPFRASLLPDGPLMSQPLPMATTRPRLVAARRLPSDVDLRALGEATTHARQPLIVVGPLDQDGVPAAIARLASVLGAPIVADALANLRLGPHDRSHLVARGDALLRSPSFCATHAADLIIRFGGTPTSAATLAYLEASPADQLLVDDGGWNEPTLLAGTLIHARSGCVRRRAREQRRVPARRRGRGWTAGWPRAVAPMTPSGRYWPTIDEPFEAGVPAALEGNLPDAALVVVGSSMPVRDLDGYLAPGTTPVRCLANRGVNGIDGVVSTALGVAAAAVGPVLLLVGDIAFVHDLNALVAARLHGLSATIVIIDNDGGGIFSFLPQGTAARPDIGLPEHFEELFGTPHGIDLLAVARILGAEADDLEPGSVGPVIRDSMTRPGVRVLRLRTDRGRNVELHARVTTAAARAIG